MFYVEKVNKKWSISGILINFVASREMQNEWFFRLYSTCPGDEYRRRNWKKVRFPNFNFFSDFYPRIFRPCMIKFGLVLIKKTFNVSRYSKWKQIKYIFDFWQKHLELSTENFPKVFQNCIRRVLRHLLGILSKFGYLYGLRTRVPRAWVTKL